jgi:uncharacterized protein DUF559
VIDLPKGLHGAFLREDLVCQIGLPSVRVLLRDGQLVRYSRSVLLDRRYMFDLLTRATAALLLVGPRAVLTSHTTALLYGCSAADEGVIHVLSGYDRKVPRRPGLYLRQGFFDEADVVELNGLRSLRLDLVVAELLCTAHRPVALACADQALAEINLNFRDEFRAQIARRIYGRADPRGTRRGEALLGLATGLPESPAESRLLLALYDAGLPLPTLQHSIQDLAGQERYRLDFAWEEPRVALEYDGFEAHEDRKQEDAARDAELRARGWLVVRAGAADLRDPKRFVRVLRAEFARRRFAA